MSTGPKTQEGKLNAAKRGFKGGKRILLRDLGKNLKIHRNEVKNLIFKLKVLNSGNDYEKTPSTKIPANNNAP